MGNGNILTYGSVFYSMLLIVVFFSRQRLKTFENKIYSMLIISNFCGLIIAILCYFTVLHYEQMQYLNYIISRLYLVYLVAFIFLFFYYLIATIQGEKYEKSNLKKKYLNYFIIAFIAIIVLIYKLPLYYSNLPGAVYSFGPAANLIYIIATICMFSWSILLIINYKKHKSKKFIPIITFIIGAMLTTIIQKLNPGLLLMTSMETFVVVVMYFTIENPDMKLLEEVHKSKEISDSANEEKTMFLYNMTQEIRNTTDEINDSANEILDSNSIDENKDSARNIIATTSKFTSMTNEILDVSQVDSETIKTYNSKYDIKNTLKQIVNIYNEECKKKTLEFRTNIDHDIPESLYGDSISLKEALNKILKNSLNNTTTGYIEFNVNTIIKNDVCRLIITIEDSSNGIQSEELNTIKKDNKLLSEANSLIGVMNGAMMISSDYGVGTKVKVILDQKIVESENKEVIKYVSTLDNVNVLVCDTDSGLKVITKLLEGSNVKLDKVDNGKELLESIKENKYDVVLMDESTSTNNQILVSKMKSIRNFNSEIILLTRDNSYEYNDEYKNLGFDDYILKPLKKDILLEKINKYKDN